MTARENLIRLDSSSADRMDQPQREDSPIEGGVLISVEQTLVCEPPQNTDRGLCYFGKQIKTPNRNIRACGFPSDLRASPEQS